MKFPSMFRVYDLFNADDRATGSLPPELEGKSPLEVAQYYQRQARQQVVQPPDRRPGNPPPPPPPPPSREDFDANPLEVTQRMITQQTVSRNEFDALTQAARMGLVGAAKMVAQQGKKYWIRLLPQMDDLAKSADPISTTNPEWWNTTYNYLVGSNLTTLQSEEAEVAAAAARASSEGVSNPGTPPPEPRQLQAVERELANGLGISENAWREGEVKMRDGRLPVTLDNRRIA